MNEELRPDEAIETGTAGTEEASYVPASIYTRVWAWTGVVYMVIIVLLVTWFIATGTFLTGIAGIMLFPVLGGFSVNKGIQSFRLEDKPERVVSAAWCALSAVLCAASLAWGIVQLIGIFGG